MLMLPLTTSNNTGRAICSLLREAYLETEVSPVNANCPQRKELDMSSTRPQARSKISRRDVIRLLASSLLLIRPTNCTTQQCPLIADQIAKAYGLESFGQIEAIRYTWNL